MKKTIYTLIVATSLYGCSAGDESSSVSTIKESKISVKFSPKIGIELGKAAGVFNDKFDTEGYQLCYLDQVMPTEACLEIPSLLTADRVELTVRGNTTLTLKPNDGHDSHGFAVKLDGATIFSPGGSEEITINASNTRYAGIVLLPKDPIVIDNTGTFIAVGAENKKFTNENSTHHYAYVDATIQRDFPITVKLENGEVITATLSNAVVNTSYQYTIRHEETNPSGIVINTDTSNLGVVDGCIGSACGVPVPESSPITLTGLNLNDVDSIVTVVNTNFRTLAQESKGMKDGAIVDLDMSIAGTLPACSDTQRPPVHIGQLDKLMDGWHIATIKLPVSQNPDCKFVFEERKYLVKNDGTLAYDTINTPLANLSVQTMANTALNNTSNEIIMVDSADGMTYAVTLPEADAENADIILKPMRYGNFGQGGYGNITSYDGTYYIATYNTNGLDVYMLVNLNTGVAKKINSGLVGYGAWNLINNNGDFLVMADPLGASDRKLHIVNKETGELTASDTVLNNHQVGFYSQNAFVFRDGETFITATGSLISPNEQINITSGVIGAANLHDGYKYDGVVQIIKGDYLITSNVLKDTFTKYNYKTGEIISKTIEGLNHQVLGMNENIVIVQMEELGSGDTYIAEFNFNTSVLTDTRILEGDNLVIIEIKPI